MEAALAVVLEARLEAVGAVEEVVGEEEVAPEDVAEEEVAEDVADVAVDAVVVDDWEVWGSRRLEICGYRSVMMLLRDGYWVLEGVRGDG